MLCERCRCIALDADGPNGLLTETFSFELKDSYSSLKHSAEAGCECCAVVMDSLETDAPGKPNRRGPISLRKDGNVRAVMAPYIDDIGVHLEGQGNGIPLLRIFTTDGTVYVSTLREATDTEKTTMQLGTIDLLGES
jgi:hypothetical protein